MSTETIPHHYYHRPAHCLLCRAAVWAVEFPDGRYELMQDGVEQDGYVYLDTHECPRMDRAPEGQTS